MGKSHWVHCEKSPAEAVLPSPAEEVQPATVLKQFYSAFIESVLCTSITVWFNSTTKSYLRRLRRVVRIIGTTLPILQELYLSRVRKGAGKNHSGPLTSSTLLLWTVAVWSTLQSSVHQNNQTQEQFLPPSNPSHEHLALNMDTQHYYTLFIHYTYLFFLFQICT